MDEFAKAKSASSSGGSHSIVAPLNLRLRRVRSTLPLWLQAWLPDLPPPTTRNLWLCLALLVAIQNCWVIQNNFGSRDTVLAMLLWGGGLICIEDQLEDLRPQPGLLGLVVGSVLLLWLMARTATIVSMNGVLYVLTPLAGVALTLLCQPLRHLMRFRDACFCLLLFPVSKVVAWWLIPDQQLSEVTALGAAFWLSILGLDVAVDGRKVFLPGGAVSVAGICNGIEIITMLICISAIFLLAFPVRSRRSRVILILMAPVLGLISNTTRIALLAILSSMGKSVGRGWFTFFHDNEGSLIFSAIAVFAYGAIYMRLLERELPPLDRQQQSGQES